MLSHRYRIAEGGETGNTAALKFTPTMEIDGHQLEPDAPAFFIAEAGVNHNGEIEIARKLIDVAADAGADAVKFQTFTTDRLVTDRAKTVAYQNEAVDGPTDQQEILEGVELSRDTHLELSEYAHTAGVTFLSTPFDRASASFLADIGVPAIKLGSGELTNEPLLRHAAGLARPLIISTGMATVDEVANAVAWLEDEDPVSFALLQCTSEYPTNPKDVNLRVMTVLRERFDVPTGLSDHTVSTVVPGMAVAAGARIVEKHFTLDRGMEGPDHAASLEPDELAESVECVRLADQIRGSARKRPTSTELRNRIQVRKSLHAARDLEEGVVLEDSDLTVSRPADGLPPYELSAVLGRRTARALATGEPILDDALEGA